MSIYSSKKNRPVSIEPLQKKHDGVSRNPREGVLQLSRLIGETGLQAKLKVGNANDRCEQEADRVADRVMATPTATSVVGAVSGGITPLTAQCREEEEEEETVQLKEEQEDELQAKAGPNFKGRVPASVEGAIRSSKGGGAPLKPVVQAQMEGRFGVDFSAVRLHSDTTAVQMNRAIGAQAFTHGSHIYFNSGKLDQQGSAGRHLLAHELTHVVQQGGGKPFTGDAGLPLKNQKSRVLPQAKLKIGQLNDLYEQEADRGADTVMRMPKYKNETISDLGRTGRSKYVLAKTSSAGPSCVFGATVAPDICEGSPSVRCRSDLMLQRSEGQGPVLVPDNASSLGGGIFWRGINASANGAALRSQFETLVESGGLSALRDWVASFLGVDRSVKEASASAISGGDVDIDAIDGAVAAESLKLENDAANFVGTLRPKATNVATELLDASQKRIEEQLKQFGIGEREIRHPEREGGKGAPPAYPTEVRMDNVQAGLDAQAAARNLAVSRREADKALEGFSALLFKEHPDYPKIQRQLPPELQNKKYNAAEHLWKMTEDIYAKQALAATEQFPVLAIYASGKSSAAALEGFAATPPQDLGETIWRESQDRLANIETVRSELWGRYNSLLNDRIVGIALAQEEVASWQKRVAEDHIAGIREAEAADATFMATLAIALGLIAAIPTGGSSLAAGIVAAATASGAALAVYNAYEHWVRFQLTSAAGETDYAKAKALCQAEGESWLWLALEIVGAVVEMTVALAMFKNLVKVIKQARASKNVLAMAEAVDAAAPPGAAMKIKAHVADDIGPEAISELIVAEGAKFRSGDLSKIRATLEQAAYQGWDDAYDALAAQGKIRPLTSESLIAHLKRYPASDPNYSNLAAEYIAKLDVQKHLGIYDPKSGIIFIKPGGQHEVATIVAHEIVHAGQARMGQELISFWAEFEAFSAQKRLIHALERAGVDLKLTENVAWLRTASDMDIAMAVNAIDPVKYPIPYTLKGFGKGDEMIAKNAISAAKRVLAVSTQ